MYIIYGILFSIILIVIDQVTKLMALNLLKPVGSISVIEGILNFTFVENHGAAFGILQGARWFFIISTVIVTCCIIYYYINLPKDRVHNYIRFSLILIFAGAIGNFIDRLLKGYVLDFIHVTFIDFPVFNVADIYVVVGTICLAILVIFFMKSNEENDTKDALSLKSKKSQNLKEV